MTSTFKIVDITMDSKDKQFVFETNLIYSREHIAFQYRDIESDEFRKKFYAILLNKILVDKTTFELATRLYNYSKVFKDHSSKTDQNIIIKSYIIKKDVLKNKKFEDFIFKHKFQIEKNELYTNLPNNLSTKNKLNEIQILEKDLIGVIGRTINILTGQTEVHFADLSFFKPIEHTINYVSTEPKLVEYQYIVSNKQLAIYIKFTCSQTINSKILINKIRAYPLKLNKSKTIKSEKFVSKVINDNWRYVPNNSELSENIERYRNLPRSLELDQNVDRYRDPPSLIF